jgi:ankyrin repeat protein
MLPAKDDDWYEKELEKERLHRAASEGDIEQMRTLLNEGLPINAFDSLERTPLHCAAIGDHIEAVRYLIKAGADVNAHDEERIGETPLGKVAANCTFEMAKVLIDAGADPTILGWMTNTALDRSAARKKPEGKRVHKLLVDTVKKKKPSWSRLRHYL